MNLSPSRFPIIPLDRPWSALLAAFRPHRAKSLALSLGLAVVGISMHSVQAAPATWNALPTNGNWEAEGAENNWSTGAATFPGAIGTLTNTDVATFLTSVTTAIAINSTTGNTDALNIGGITFGNVASASAFTIGSTSGNALWLSSGGQIGISSGRTVAGATETINAPIVLQPVDGTSAGTYTFSNASALAGDIFNFGGTITGGTTTQGITLTLTGASTTANTISGIISDGGAAGGVSINKTSGGTWTLNGVNTFTGGITLAASGGTLNIGAAGQLGSGSYAGSVTIGSGSTVNYNSALAQTLSGTTTGGGNLVNGGTNTLTLTGTNASSSLNTLRSVGAGTLTVNNASANITVAAQSNYGASSNFGKFILTAGTVAFNGGIQSATSSGALAGADGMGFIVNGGTFSASFVSLGRSYNFSTTSFATVTTAQTMGTSGFQVNGGTATVTGNVDIAGSNSSANGQVSGAGSLTIGGELRLGATNTRTNLFQVTGGTLTVNNTTNGLVIGRGTATAATSGELLLTGGTTTTEKITFGLNGGLAGSQGNLTLNGAGANLYIGSGGIVLAATNAFTTQIDLRSGTLGASAGANGLSTGWSSSLAMSLNGSGVIIKAADAANVTKNISLSGVISGGNGFTKTGIGTLTLASTGNGYSGITTIAGGTLNINSVWQLGGGVYGGLTAGASGGTLQYASTLLNGATDITQDTSDGGLGVNGAARNVTLTGTLTVDTNGNDVTYKNTFGNSGAGGLTKTGAGNLTLSGSGTYTGPTTVNAGTLLISGSIAASTSVDVNGGGTLLLGGANNISRLKDDAAVTLGAGATPGTGGIFATGGLNEGPAGGAIGSTAAMGTLALSVNSTLDFTTGDTATGSNLLFAGLSYTPGDAIRILNWTGTIGTDDVLAAGNDRLLFINAPLLSDAQLASIQFFSDGGSTMLGSGAHEISFNGYYEIVPIPEPSSAALVGAAALLGLGGFRKRRRFVRG